MKIFKTFLTLFISAGILFPVVLSAQQTIPSRQQQIKAAVQAAPPSFRAGAKVYGYNPQGNWTTLREGSNELICIADDPAQSNFHVACYAASLEPFMKRGRQLREKGFTRKQVDQQRRQEIEADELDFPDRASTLYSLTGQQDAYNYATGTLNKAQSLTVVYVPFGTPESTGMTPSPFGPGTPWLMEAGMPWAHIMIPGPPVGEATK